jgi:hypothetical protein
MAIPWRGSTATTTASEFDCRCGHDGHVPVEVEQANVPATVPETAAQTVDPINGLKSSPKTIHTRAAVNSEGKTGSVTPIVKTVIRGFINLPVQVHLWWQIVFNQHGIVNSLPALS